VVQGILNILLGALDIAVCVSDGVLGLAMRLVETAPHLIVRLPNAVVDFSLRISDLLPDLLLRLPDFFAHFPDVIAAAGCQR